MDVTWAPVIGLAGLLIFATIMAILVLIQENKAKRPIPHAKA